MIITFVFFLATAFSQKPCAYPINTSRRDPSELIDSLEKQQVKTSNKKKHIPKFIRKNLDCWTGKFRVANPGKPYQATDFVDGGFRHTPIRQLTYLGLNRHYLILTYKKGGRGANDFILLFKFENKKILEFWIGSGVRLSSYEEVIYILKNYGDKLNSSNLYL